MWVRLSAITIMLLSSVLFVCKAPTGPGPESAFIALEFRNSSGKIAKQTLTDTVGKQVTICLIHNLVQFIDASTLKITMGNDFSKIYKVSTYRALIDTINYPIVFDMPGNYSVNFSCYIEDQLRSINSFITIVDRPQTPQNQKPVLNLPQELKIGVGQEVTFVVSATDPDVNQQVTINVVKIPQTATFTTNQFKWTPAMSDTGIASAIFTATDNGSSALFTTDTCLIIVNKTAVNRAPKWSVTTMQCSSRPDSLFSLDLSGYCSDPDNDSLKFLLLPIAPAKGTIVGKMYQFKPSISDTGVHSISIITIDPSGLSDTFTLELSISKNSTKPDTIAPSIVKQPISQSVCTGSQAFFSVTATGSGPLSYQWRTGATAPFTNIGSNNPICTLTTAATSILSCVVSNQAGMNSTSSLCTLTINEPAGIPTGAAAPSVVCPGSNQQVTLSATGVTGSGGSWVWYEGDKTTKVTINPFTPSATKSYYVRSEGAACGAGPWSSTAVTVTVNQPAISPTGISATPQSFCGSGTVALKVVGGSLGTGGAAWKWYRNATCSGTSFASGAEVTDTITATTTYGVRAEGGSCNLSTNPVTLTVPLNVAAGVPTGTAIPESVCPGDMVTLSASGNPGTGGSWVWYKSDKKTPVSATTFAAQGSETYYVRSENGACGDGPFSTSVGVTIKIPSTNPTGININKTLPVCKYASVTLTVLGGSLGTNAKWVWYTNSSYVGTPVASSTLTSLTVTPENTTTYYVRAEGDCNNTTASISQKIDVYTGLSVLVSQTESQGACGYATFNYKAVATGSTGYTYEWQRTVEDGTFVSFDVYLSRLGPTGINSETLVINDQQFNGSIFQIRCVVNDICGKTVITDPIYYSSGAYIECP